MDVLTYSRLDAELCFRFQAAWDAQYIQVSGLWYDRREWQNYRREKRRWAREDPTVLVPKPQGFR